MKNPAKPGDFGTNGARGVVLSGMTEKTIIGVAAMGFWFLCLVLPALPSYRGSYGHSAFAPWAAAWCAISAIVCGSFFVVLATSP